MVVQHTTLTSWIELQASLSHKQEEVYFALQTLGSATNKAIGFHLEWPINKVCPRVQELRKLGVVVCTMNNPHLIEVDECPCKVVEHGRPAIPWMIVKKRW